MNGREGQLSTSFIAHAVKAKCGEQVRPAALRILETGVSPFQWIASRKAGQTLRVDSAWPLPLPEYLVPLLRTDGRAIAPHGPHYDVLLDMAIAAKQPDEVLRWYDKMDKGKNALAADGDWQGAEQMIAWPPQLPSPIPNGLHVRA